MAFPHVHHHLLPTPIHSTKEKELPSSSNVHRDRRVFPRTYNRLGACSIGIHASFSPMFDLGKEPRSGRVQKAILLPMTVQGGLNAVPFIERGSRQVLMELLTPFKAVMDLGGAKAGV
ncbi:hypothetical protein B0H19DRAFT_1260839 [Mycena capillaripes]|nr:hypothetical protein B0H19DRAFT_1260839 [Mycena capillaripes]